jgi:hypothetical protein
VSGRLIDWLITTWQMNAWLNDLLQTCHFGINVVQWMSCLPVVSITFYVGKGSHNIFLSAKFTNETGHVKAGIFRYRLACYFWVSVSQQYYAQRRGGGGRASGQMVTPGKEMIIPKSRPKVKWNWNCNNSIGMNGMTWNERNLNIR